MQLAPGAIAGLQCVLSSSYSGIQREQGVRGNVTRVGDRSVPSSPSNRTQLLCRLPNGNVQKVIKKTSYDLGHPMSYMHYYRRATWYQHVSQVSHDATSQDRRSMSAHIRELVELLNTRACGVVGPDSLPIFCGQSLLGELRVSEDTFPSKRP